MLSRQPVKHHCCEVLGDIGRNWSMVLISLTITMVALLVLGIFLLVTVNVNLFIELAGTHLQIQVFVREDVEESDIEVFARHLSDLDDVLSVEFVPRAKALKDMQERLGKETSKFIQGNPFPDSFRLTLKDTDDVDGIVDSLYAFDVVEDIEYGGEFSTQMRFVLKMVRGLTLVLGIFLVAAVVLIISNTVNLTVMSRQNEIEVMKLIGATDSFIAFPFVAGGVAIGMFAALAAFLLLSVLYNTLLAMLCRTIPFLPHAAGLHVVVKLFCGLVGCGGMAGFLGSMLSVRKLLRQRLA